jgi:epoxyqueuosine reductase
MEKVISAIRTRALELGFDACRFTTARPPDSAARFQRWLEAGRHGRMAYLERTARKRIEPGQVLAAARSIITLAVSYAWDATTPNLNPNPNFLGRAALLRRPNSGQSGSSALPGRRSFLSSAHPNLNESKERLRLRADGTERPSGTESSSVGQIARYARFSDYHDVVGARLKTLADFVNKIGAGETRSLWYMDAGPLLERDLAQRAGLGFIGKHTNLISRKLGNWFFLAEIITTLELPPDAPERNRCGSCRRCLDACPTAAIVAPFQLDARRCISYLTIELKGPIPEELRAAVGNRIFGCDDCLAVCPWNRFARAGSMMAEHRRAGLEGPDLAELLSLDEAGFRARFAGTPVLRAKRRGFLRNVCVALGNTGDAKTLPALQRAASDPEPVIAEHALWAIEQIRKYE